EDIVIATSITAPRDPRNRPVRNTISYGLVINCSPSYCNPFADVPHKTSQTMNKDANVARSVAMTAAYVFSLKPLTSNKDSNVKRIAAILQISNKLQFA